MGNAQPNSSIDTFAWLIHKEVEAYVNENLADYEQWLSAQNLVDTSHKMLNNQLNAGNERSK